MDALLKIEGGSLKGAAAEIADALVRIIEAKGEQATIQKALEAFKQTVAIEGVTIRDCDFRTEAAPQSPPDAALDLEPA